MNSNERSLQRASLCIRPHFLKFLEMTERIEKREESENRTKEQNSTPFGCFIGLQTYKQMQTKGLLNIILSCHFHKNRPTAVRTIPTQTRRKRRERERPGVEQSSCSLTLCKNGVPIFRIIIITKNNSPSSFNTLPTSSSTPPHSPLSLIFLISSSRLAMSAILPFVFLLFFHFLPKSEPSPYLLDKISSLPGQPLVGFRHYSGYVNVGDRNQKALFYYFAEAQINSASRPLVLWLNGGISLLNFWGFGFLFCSFV